jgi:pimeloyl-ACP methyl ester carboxylesterase
MNMPHIAIQIAILFSLLLAAFTAQVPHLADSSFQPGDCVFQLAAGVVEGQDVSCGYLIVPSDHSFPDGPELKLAVAVFKHQGEQSQTEPLFILQGGPGGSTLETHSLLIQDSVLLENFDIVLLEQRGTLYSQPSLVCDEANQYFVDHLNTDLPSEEYNKLWEQVLSKCHERLVLQGVRLSDFDSIQNARDVEALRLALGHEKINLYGVSYGSLLALHYLRLFPTGLHAVVLDGVVPPQVNYVHTNILDQDRVFRLLFSACKNSKECSDSYPGLENVFFKVIDELEKSPAHVVLHDQETGKAHEALIDGESFYSGIYQAFYSAEFIAAIPRMIYKADERDFAGFTQLLSLIIFDRTMSYGMYYSVNCAEEEADSFQTPLDLSEVHPKIVEFNEGDTKSFVASCTAWDVESLGPAANEPVKSDIPVLLLSGGFDPVTPERNAALAASTLNHAYAYTIPSGGHGQAFGNKCADSIILAFLKNPVTSPDAGCISEYSMVDFWGRHAVVPVPLFGRVLNLERDLLWPFVALAVFSLGLSSSLVFLPFAWFIKLFSTKSKRAETAQDSPPVVLPEEQPALARPALRPDPILWFAGPVAMLNGLIVPLFWAALVSIFIYTSVARNMMVLWGIPSELRLLFLLPLLSACLTLLMLWETFSGWRTTAWSIWRKLYYSILTVCAIACTLIALYLDVLFPLFK